MVELGSICSGMILKQLINNFLQLAQPCHCCHKTGMGEEAGGLYPGIIAGTVRKHCKAIVSCSHT